MLLKLQIVANLFKIWGSEAVVDKGQLGPLSIAIVVTPFLWTIVMGIELLFLSYVGYLWLTLFYNNYSLHMQGVFKHR